MNVTNPSFYLHPHAKTTQITTISYLDSPSSYLVWLFLDNQLHRTWLSILPLLQLDKSTNCFLFPKATPIVLSLKNLFAVHITLKPFHLQHLPSSRIPPTLLPTKTSVLLWPTFSHYSQWARCWRPFCTLHWPSSTPKTCTCTSAPYTYILKTGQQLEVQCH